MKIRTLAVVATMVTIGVMTTSSPASARWVYRNGEALIDLTSESETEPTVCANRIRGRVGESDSFNTDGFDPNTYVPPSGPFGTRTVEVYASGEFDLTGAQIVPGGIEPFNAGIVLAPVATQTTAALAALSPVEIDVPDFNPFITNVYYAAAPFEIVPPAGTIDVGDSVLITRPGSTAYVNAKAVACTPTATTSTTTTTTTTTSTTTTTTTTTTAPPAVAPKIDIVPGIHPNIVVPWLKAEVLPVRLFGSATFKVSTVTNVKLGSAPAALLPPRLAFLGAARDYNRDGFADRDYYFSPAATGIKCSSKSATLTGKAATKSFSATDSVKPIWC